MRGGADGRAGKRAGTDRCGRLGAGLSDETDPAAGVNDPQIKQRFQELGVVENTSTPDGMRKRVINEIARWNALIDKAKVPRL